MSEDVLEQLGKYQLIRKLATGGMAEVFLAKAAGPAGFQKTLVVKRILPHLAQDPEFIEMFFSEARIAAALNHPNIVQIFDFGKEGETYYLAMEFIDGPNLRTLYKLAQAVGMSVPFHLAAKIISLACEGLAFAHDHCNVETGQPLNLIHRDVSPDNIILSRSGAVKLVDFGIAKASIRRNMTRAGVVKGKMAYMPPEQLCNETLDRRADIFALGMVFYELLCGDMPFDANNENRIIEAMLSQEPFGPITEHRRDVPPMLVRVLAKALEKNPANRYPSCKALQEDVDRFILSLGRPVQQYELAELIQKLEAAGAAAPPSATPPGNVRPSADSGRHKRSPPPPPPPAPPEAAYEAPDGEDPFGATVIRKPGKPERPVGLDQGTRLKPAARSGNVAEYDLETRIKPAGRPAGGAELDGETRIMPVSHAGDGEDRPGAGGRAERAVEQGEPRARRWPERSAERRESVVSRGPEPRPGRGRRAPILVVLAALALLLVGGGVFLWRGGPEGSGARPPATARSPGGAPRAVVSAAQVPQQEPPSPGGVGSKGASSPGADVPEAAPLAGPEPSTVEVQPGSISQKPAHTEPMGKSEPVQGSAPRPRGQGLVEFRVRPSAQVFLDGKLLGETPFPPVITSAGRHVIRLVDTRSNRDATVDFIVKPGEENIFTYDFEP